MSSQKELIENLNEIKNQKETLLTPENIRAGVTLLGVEGSSEVVDTSDATADGDDILKGKVAYSKGYKITGMYEPLDTSDATAKPENITNGKTAYVNGQKITGSIPTNGNLYYTPSTESQTIPAGYTEGGTVWGDSNLKASNIKKGVTIFNTEGEYVGDLDTTDATATSSDILSGETAYVNGIKITGTMPNNGQQAITPSKSVQQYPNGYYSGVYVAGDSNLVPANIKAGTTIFGITGDLDVSLDTSDGNATANDIMKDKVAYAKGERIVGQHECLNTNDATAYANELLAGQTAYVKGEKITGTMQNIPIYEAMPDKENTKSYYPHGYVQTIRVKSVTDSINEYTLPNVIGSHAQGGLKGLTELTKEISTSKGCRVFAFVVNRAAISSYSDGWEEVTSDIINYELHQEMHIYTKIAESITETFTVTQSEANRLFLTMLAYDTETNVEIVSEIHDDTKTQQTVSMQGNFLPGDIVVGHYEYNAEGKTDPSYNSTLSGPTYIAYKTPDDIDRLFVYVLTSKTSSMTFDLKYQNPYGIKVLRFTSAQPLIPENIRKGVKIMDFIGSFEGEFDHSDATVTADKLVKGVKAYDSQGLLIEGTMKDNGSLEFTPNETTQEIPEGYTLGGIVNAVDITTLKEYNDCLTLAKSVGSTEVYEGTTATAEDIREGKTAYSNGEKITGKLLAGSGINLKITNCAYLFAYGAKKEYYKELLGVCENVTQMNGMFYYYDESELDLSDFIDTSNVTNMGYMFQGSSITKLDLTGFNTSKVTAMPSMINSCDYLTDVDMSNLDLTQVTDVGYMFAGDDLLVNLKLTGVTIPKVTRMTGMFNTCTSLSKESLNQILALCASATSYKETKSLAAIGVPETVRSKASSCSNYSAFYNAGWMVG